MFAAPPVLTFMVENATGFDLSTLRSVTSGGAHPPVDLFPQLVKHSRNSNLHVKNIFGMTELSSFASTHINGTEPPQNAASMGVLVVGMRMKILNTETGARHLPYYSLT